MPPPAYAYTLPKQQFKYKSNIFQLVSPSILQLLCIMKSLRPIRSNSTLRRQNRSQVENFICYKLHVRVLANYCLPICFSSPVNTVFKKFINSV